MLEKYPELFRNVRMVLNEGGTGTLGRPAARRLLERGHEVRVLTRQLSPALPGGAAAVRGDLSTGAGVAQAVERADAVLHAASNTGLGLGRGDVEATRRLLDAALGAGVAHLLYVSIVGIDRIPLGYFRLLFLITRIHHQGSLTVPCRCGSNSGGQRE